MLIKYETLFDGTLGEWKGEPVNFEKVEGAQPHSQRHFPVPHLYKKAFKKELDRLESLGVLEKVQQSEWGSPTFIIPKKDMRVRCISDFRKLNQKIKRKPYPLPRIIDTLQQLGEFQYATSFGFPANGVIKRCHFDTLVSQVHNFFNSCARTVNPYIIRKLRYRSIHW